MYLPETRSHQVLEVGSVQVRSTGHRAFVKALIECLEDGVEQVTEAVRTHISHTKMIGEGGLITPD